MNLSDYRENYNKRKLDEVDLHDDPFTMFNQWFNEVLSLGIEDPTAMALSTCDGNGKPSSRMVLLKGLDHGGFVFFTNYLGRKAGELKVNPYAALLFYWKDLQCQVRIEGKVRKIAVGESDQYFRSRPTDSRIAAVISPQSSVIPGRQWLDERAGEFRQKYAGNEVERPDHWGGYVLLPEQFEFWQGRENRLHDRFRYSRDGSQWVIERLAP